MYVSQHRGREQPGCARAAGATGNLAHVCVPRTAGQGSLGRGEAAASYAGAGGNLADVPRPDKGTWAREEAAASCMRQAQQQPHSCLCPTAGQGSLSARTSHGLFRVSGGGNLAYVHIPTAG